MKAVLVGSLDRIEYDKQGRAVRLFPSQRRSDAPKSIVIDPRRAFGRPVIVGTAVPAADVRFLASTRATESRSWRSTSRLLES